MKIVNTGSLGNIGKPLTETLVKKGHDTTVISHSKERQKDIEGLGATSAIGDLSDVGFLKSAFAEADALFCMVPPDYSVPNIQEFFREIGNNYAAAIKDSGIERVVFISSYGAELDSKTGPVLGSHNVEGILNELEGIQLTHIRATSFYYNFLGLIDIIKQNGMIMANYGEDKIAMVSPKDIAAAVANELTDPTGQKIRYVASDERTGQEVASVLGKAIGKPDLKWNVISDEEMQNRLEQSGIPARVAQLYVDMYSSLRNGRLNADYKRNKPESFGKVKIEDYAKDFAVAYNQK